MPTAALRRVLTSHGQLGSTGGTTGWYLPEVAHPHAETALKLRTTPTSTDIDAAAGGVVGAVCHGPARIVNAKLSDGSYLVDGKTVSTFTNEEEMAVGLSDVVPFLLETRLAERGEKITTAPNFAAHHEVSERLVIGQHPASAKGVAERIVALVRDRSDLPTG